MINSEVSRTELNKLVDLFGPATIPSPTTWAYAREWGLERSQKEGVSRIVRVKVGRDYTRVWPAAAICSCAWPETHELCPFRARIAVSESTQSQLFRMLTGTLRWLSSLTPHHKQPTAASQL